MGERGADQTYRIITGIGLIGLGAFGCLSLVPVDALGPGIARLFPSGNVVGPIGAMVATELVGVFGLAAVLVAALPLLWGLFSLGAVNGGPATRLSLLFASLIVCLPPLVASVGHPAGGPGGAAGRYGRAVGGALGSAVGWLGLALVLVVLLGISVIATLGLEPFRRLGRAVAVAGRGGRRALGLVGRGAVGLAAGLGGLGRRGRSGVRVAHTWLADRWEALQARAVARSDRGLGLATSGAPPPPSTAEPEPPERPEPRRSVPAPELPDPGGPVEPGTTDLPPLDLLTPSPDQDYSVDETTLDQLGEILIEKLRTFRVDGRIGGRTTGPVVTQFEVIPASGVKVSKIASMADDLALALKAPSIRIIAPIPGKGAVGVEVPNPERKIVYLRDQLESGAYRRGRAELPLALGEDVTGEPYVADLARMPHLLIAGVTGSGKSVCINAILASLIYRHTPDRLRLLLIDPKMVELGGYNALPHLRHPVVTDNEDAATVLKWLVYEMERRYEWLSENGCRNLREFNQRVTRGAPARVPESEGGGLLEDPEILPYIVLVIDELADLMMTVQSDVERPLAFLAQKARATGIHLVVATQRPSVNVITGLIKANFPCRVAFRVASKVDSRTIIDQNGAETLLGNGDMLFLPPGEAEPVRVQGAYVSSEDTERLRDWYQAQAELAAAREAAGEHDILEQVREFEREEAEVDIEQEVLEDRDALFRQAAEVVVQHEQGSTSLLQRRLKIGYGRAARIVDQLHHAGIVGPSEGSKPREVLVTLDDLDRICGST